MNTQQQLSPESAPPRDRSVNGDADRRHLPRISFVIPLKDEEDSVASLCAHIAREARSVASWFEIVLVDDGSQDDSWEIISELASSQHLDLLGRVRGIRLRRNVGKARALLVGFREAEGDIVFTLDADLQDDPRDIPSFLEELGRGFDLVSGWKRLRRDPWHKVLPSRVFNWMTGRLLGIRLHDHNCGFKCYRREVVRDLDLYGEMHRMIPALADMQGYRVSEVPVRHHPRLFGRSKYGFRRFWRGFTDLLTVHYLANFRERPAHLFLANALLVFASGALLVGQSVVGMPSANGPTAGLTLLPIFLVGAIFLMHFALFSAHLVHASLSKEWIPPILEDTAQESDTSSAVFRWDLAKRKRVAPTSPLF